MKIGDTLTACYQQKLKNGAKDFYVVLEVGKKHDDWLLGCINSSQQFDTNSHIIPEDIVDFEFTPLKRSYLMHRKITLFESFYELPVSAIVTEFHGEDTVITFQEHDGNLLSDAYYEFKFEDKIHGGYLFIYYSNEIG